MMYLIIGNGFVANYLKENIPDSIIYDGKINSIDDLRKLFDLYPGHILINCAGKTGRPNVDWCESNKEETFDSNVRLPMLINEASKELGRYWVHISSGCIYKGYKKNWSEDDKPNFFGSFYSKTKIWSESILGDDCLVLRIRMPITDDKNERSYLAKLIGFSKNGEIKNKCQNSITYMEDFKNALVFLTEKHYYGTFNIVNDGSLSAPEILGRSNIPFRVSNKEDEDTMNHRSNCILSIDKLKRAGFNMPSIEDRLINKE